MNGDRIKMRRLYLFIFVFLLFIGVAYFAIHRKSADTVQPGKALPEEVLKITSQYIQAREDRMGADQASPTSWIEGIKNIATSDWYQQLQPPTNSSTSTTPFAYKYAHQNGYIVKAGISGCGANDILSKPTATSALVVCNLTDETISKANGSSIPASELTVGWPYVGHQSPAQISVVKENGHWLVSGDATGQGL